MAGYLRWSIHEEMMRRVAVVASGAGIFDKVPATYRDQLRSLVDKYNDQFNDRRVELIERAYALMERVFCRICRAEDAEDTRQRRVLETAHTVNTTLFFMQNTLDDEAYLKPRILMLQDAVDQMSGVEDEFQTATTPHMLNITKLAIELL